MGRTADGERRRRPGTCGRARATATVTDPVGGSSGTMSLPHRVRALAIEMTILPARCSSQRCDGAEHAIPRRRHDDQIGLRRHVSLSSGWRVRWRSGHRSVKVLTVSAARSFDREPTTTSIPMAASCTDTALPAGPVAPNTPIRTLGRLARPAPSGRPGGGFALATVPGCGTRQQAAGPVAPARLPAGPPGGPGLSGGP